MKKKPNRFLEPTPDQQPQGLKWQKVNLEMWLLANTGKCHSVPTTAVLQAVSK